MAHHEAVLAAGDRQAARAHRLHLAIAHAGEIGADDVAGGLEHPLLGRQGLGVEARSPRSPLSGSMPIGVSMPPTSSAELGDGCLDQMIRPPWRDGCAAGRGHWRRYHVQVKQMCVDRRRQLPVRGSRRTKPL